MASDMKFNQVFGRQAISWLFLVSAYIRSTFLPFTNSQECLLPWQLSYSIAFKKFIYIIIVVIKVVVAPPPQYVWLPFYIIHSITSWVTIWFGSVPQCSFCQYITVSIVALLCYMFASDGSTHFRKHVWPIILTSGAHVINLLLFQI